MKSSEIHPVSYLHDHRAKLAAQQALADNEDILRSLELRGGEIAEIVQKIESDATEEFIHSLDPADAYEAVEKAIVELEQKADSIENRQPVAQNLMASIATSSTVVQLPAAAPKRQAFTTEVHEVSTVTNLDEFRTRRSR